MGEMTFLCLPEFFFGYPRNVKVAGGYEGHPRRFPLCGSTFIMLCLLKVVVCAALSLTVTAKFVMCSSSDWQIPHQKHFGLIY